MLLVYSSQASFGPAILTLGAAEFGVGEVIEILEALHVDLGEFRQLFARVVSVTVLVEALDRHRGIHVVEGPHVLETGERSPLVDQRRLVRDPDVGVR